MMICLAIPTYWTHAQGRGPVAAIYDHPTPLDDPGTLGRTLESLGPLVDEHITVVVVAAAAHPDLEAAVADRVAALVAAVGLPCPVRCFSPVHLDRLREFCRGRGRAAALPLLSLSGYGAIRNLTLVAANLLQAGLLVSLDDDEVIRDRGFFARIAADVAALSREHPRFGLAGLYENADGTVLLPEPADPWAADWPKVRWLNAAFTALLAAAAPLPATPLALGGNMVVPAAVFRAIPFDPAIPRGEDLDYVLNARLFGVPFFMDPGLRVVHLPPEKPHPLWLRLRQDLTRFVYTRRKLAGLARRPELAPVRAGDLAPYPGNFLGDDLELRALRAHTRVALDYLERSDPEAARHTLESLAVLRDEPSPGDPLAAYLEVAGAWRSLQDWLADPRVAAAARRAVWEAP